MAKSTSRGTSRTSPNPSSAPFINVCNKELSIEDFYDIYEKIEQLSACWKEIAISLRLQINTINKIEADCRGNTVTCLQKVLEHWLRKDYDYKRYGIPCWRRVCVAVKEGGGDPALADEIAREHPLPAMPPAGSTSSKEKSVTPVTDEVAMSPASTDRATGTNGLSWKNFDLTSKLHDLREEFDEAVRITKNSFESSDLPKIIDYLITHTMSLLGPNKKQQTAAQEIVYSVKNEFEHIETISDLFAILQHKYMSWFNYKLMIKLVGVFLPKNRLLKRTWSAYEKKLKDYFINSGGLLKDADAVEFGIKGVPPGTRVMIAKVDRNDYTLDDIFFFRRAIPNGLDIPEYDLHFRSVRQQKMVSLLSRFTNINIANKKGQTPLHLAVASGHKDTTEALLFSVTGSSTHHNLLTVTDNEGSSLQ
ncbi:PREDICTED: uncharacterized protein LOC109585957 [Amphimedon queenslandica]|uniref:Death domain-containing protein n=1 Tax=Amphimedon queenslandica TaxID=400682 RepID=A0AAN0JKX5_AMPQE|nr:PREDICTED: uncharacterized protein LOC109585957 [Amphimedon queenslandica]|eukprot:XP_019857663.1 PREDICTED: uncharacterized protein LOC109585957 [Amphimedon queenslandica]